MPQPPVDYPLRLPQTNEAKFLRGLNISPDASDDSLARAAKACNDYRFASRADWEPAEMPALLREAWGEILPKKGKRRGGSSEENGTKPRFTRRGPTMLRQ